MQDKDPSFLCRLSPRYISELFKVQALQPVVTSLFIPHEIRPHQDLTPLWHIAVLIYTKTEQTNKKGPAGLRMKRKELPSHRRRGQAVFQSVRCAECPGVIDIVLVRTFDAGFIEISCSRSS